MGFEEESMSAHPVVEPVPLLEELFRASAAVLGADLDGYRNYAQRVFHFARALGAEGPEAERKLAIAWRSPHRGRSTETRSGRHEGMRRLAVSGGGVERCSRRGRPSGRGRWRQEIRSSIGLVGTPLFYEQPLHIVRGEGVFLFDADGKRYLDMYNNVPCVGHANPHVVEAMQRQAATLNVHSRYLHEGVLDYAERLVAKHDASLERVVFTCTGTEANEVAIGMARLATGGRGIICTDRAYHGNSALVSKLTWAGGRSDPEIRSVRFPQTYRPIEDGLSEAELADRYLADVEAAIESFAAEGVPLAGMLVCSLLANEGLPDIPKGYMARAAKMVRDAGGLFIADEVQAGFCRSGRWWGYETSRLRAGHRHPGKAHGQRISAGGRRGSRRPGRHLPQTLGLLQHLRGKPAAGGGGIGGARRHREARSSNSGYRRGRRLPARRPRRDRVRSDGRRPRAWPLHRARLGERSRDEGRRTPRVRNAWSTGSRTRAS